MTSERHNTYWDLVDAPVTKEYGAGEESGSRVI